MSKFAYLVFVNSLMTMAYALSCHAQSSVPSDTWLTAPVAVSAKSVSFNGVLEQITKQSGVNIFVEDHSQLPGVDFEFSGGAKEALDKISNLFDYQWKVNKYGIVVLTKRFKNPKEYPQFDILELAQMAREAMGLLKYFGEAPDTQHLLPILQKLYNALTPQQRNQLREGDIIMGRRLEPQAYQCLEMAIFEQQFGQVYIAWQKLADMTETFPDWSIAFNSPHNGIQPVHDGAHLSLLWPDVHHPGQINKTPILPGTTSQ